MCDGQHLSSRPVSRRRAMPPPLHGQRERRNPSETPCAECVVIILISTGAAGGCICLVSATVLSPRFMANLFICHMIVCRIVSAGIYFLVICINIRLQSVRSATQCTERKRDDTFRMSFFLNVGLWTS
jgi:hypothetical protein